MRGQDQRSLILSPHPCTDLTWAALVLATLGFSLIYLALNGLWLVLGIAPVDLAREMLVTGGCGASSSLWGGVVDSLDLSVTISLGSN